MKKCLLHIILHLCPYLFFAQQFSEIALPLGIYHYAENNSYVGGGVGFADFNNDGWEDLYISGGDLQDKIYLNNSGISFVELLNSGIEITANHPSNGLAFGDINNDGYKDIYVLTGGLSNPLSDQLFLNNGDSTFSEIAVQAVIAQDSIFSMAATFSDYNLDGFLDLYVGGYVDSLKFIYDNYFNIVEFNHVGYRNKLYINNGDLTFTEMAAYYGLDNGGNNLALASTDFDLDFDTDIYIANDFGSGSIGNCFYVNDLMNGSFNSLAPGNGADIAIFAMGIAVGDYDDDLDLDYYVTNLGANSLLNNNLDGTFTDLAFPSGTINSHVDSVFATSWGTAFLDVNNDSKLDLFVANGYIPAADVIANASLDPNKLFINNGNGTFTDISDSANVASEERSRGFAYCDYDNDGDLDFAVGNIYRNYQFPKNTLFYQNDLNSGNWIKIKLQGTINNRDAYGAKVYISFNGKTLLRESDGGSSHCSKHSDIIHFGLDTVNFIDNISVMWPGGVIQNYGSANANQTLNIVEDTILYPIHPASFIVNNEAITVLDSVNNNTICLINFTNHHLIKIFTSSGTLKYSTNIPGIHQIDLDFLSPGDYLLKIESENDPDQLYNEFFTIY